MNKDLKGLVIVKF